MRADDHGGNPSVVPSIVEFFTVKELIVVLLAICCSGVPAQVVLDGKFGTSSALTGPNYNIGAEVGRTRGNNLFHSFTQFDLKAGDVANFTGPANIQNILSRVTGGSPSSIDGTLRSSIAGANFFFINPSGVIIGPNASVDVSGAFAVSSANYLRLEDGAKFVASLDADDSLLSSAPVAAFGFLEYANGAVEVQGPLKSAPGTPLSVIGSTVKVSDGASLEALGSQIWLKGVTTAGEVTPSIPGTIQGGNPDISGPNALGTVVIRGGRLVVENATVSVSSSGGDLKVAMSDSVEVLNGGLLTTTSSGATKGGNVVIEAPKVIIDSQDGPFPTRVAAETSSEDPLGAGGNILIRSDVFEVLRGARVSVSTFGAADAGEIEITSDSVRVIGSETFTFATEISADAAPVSGVAFGAGGKIKINASSIELALGSTISALTLGDADAGSIDLTAKTISMKDSQLTTYSSGAGRGGDIRVESGSLTLEGFAGSITALTLAPDGALPAGRGGNIDIQTGALQLLNDAAISASTFGDGRGGDVTITASSILLDTANPVPPIFPGISSYSAPSFLGFDTKGNGGDISIKTGSLTMRNRMAISAGTLTPGSGGKVNIEAGSVSIDTQAAIQSSSEGAGRAGTITLHSPGDVLLTQNGSISTSAPQSSGGDILVTSSSEVQLKDSQITARAGPGGGGNITVEAPELVYLLRGALDAQAVGDGGNLTIRQPTSVVLNESGLISKSASANGGNITINSDFFLISQSTIDASAPFGLPGTVEVTAPQLDLSGSLVPLPGNLLDVASLLRPDCAVRLSEGVSSFVVLGRGGLPLEPGGFVPSWTVSAPDEKK